MPASKLDEIRQRFPSIATLAEPTDVTASWRDLFGPGEEDPLGLFAAIMQDVLQADQAVPGRSGPRPPLDVKLARERLRQMAGDDFSYLPFPEAFGVLAGARSVRHLAHKVGLTHSRVWRLRGGKLPGPRKHELEAIARAFGKQPSYFMEYRSEYLAGFVMQRLGSNPEAAVGYYRRLTTAVR